MRAIVLRAVGGPENLSLEELLVPAPGSGQILVKTEAIGVSYAEAAVRSGAIPVPLELPATLGFEAAGTVTELGDGVDGDLLGRRVVVLNPGLGCYAEYVAVPAANATVIPDGLSSADAVVVAGHGAVALCLLRAANLTGKETVLVEVAAGGVGGYLTQLAHREGAARVIGTAGTQAKRDHAKKLGADEVLDHTAAEWEKDLAGVDVVFESLGGDTPSSLLDALTPGTGRILLYGLLRGAPEVSPVDLLFRGLTLVGCGGGGAWMDQVLRARTEVMRMAVDGVLKPQIDTVLPLEDAAVAHERFDNRLTIGKIVLTP
jgi:NADPH:quinone reductase